MDVAFRIARWSSTLTLEQIPPNVRDVARRCLMDVIGVAIAGSSHPLTQATARHAKMVYANGSCQTVTGHRLSAPGAALVNGVAAHVLDFDDTCFDGIVHGSAAVWPAVQAACDDRHRCGADMMAAFVAGVEAEYALGRALTNALYHRGWWCSGVLGAVGAAVGAARAFGLGEQMTAHAIRIAIGQTGGIQGIFGAGAKPLGIGRAAQAGIEAAMLAKQGVDGSEAIIEADGSSFAKIFNDGIWHDHEIERLGARFSLIETGIAFKTYPLCSAAQAAVEATQMLLREANIVGSDVRHVSCAVTPLVAACLVHHHPATPAQAQFSLPFAIGCILAWGQLDAHFLDMARISDPALVAEMDKVSMIADADLARHQHDHPEAALVTLQLHNGQCLSRYLGAATGMPSNPIDDDALIGKFYSCVSGARGHEYARNLLSIIHNMASIDAVPVWVHMDEFL